jgi:hypothetical protein
MVEPIHVAVHGNVSQREKSGILYKSRDAGPRKQANDGFNFSQGTAGRDSRERLNGR